MTQTKRDTLVLLVGGWVWSWQPHPIKIYSLEELLKLGEETKVHQRLYCQKKKQIVIIVFCLGWFLIISQSLQELWKGSNSVLFDIWLMVVGLRTSLFWVIKQRVVVFPYRRFRTTCPSHLQGPWKCDRWVVPKHWQGITTARCVIAQKSADISRRKAEITQIRSTWFFKNVSYSTFIFKEMLEGWRTPPENQCRGCL